MEHPKEFTPIKLSAIDQDILTVLRQRDWLYGLEMLDELNYERPKELGFGSLYPALNRLEKKGLIESKWGEENEASGGARRKYYHITGLGLTSLHATEHYREHLKQRAANRRLQPKST